MFYEPLDPRLCKLVMEWLDSRPPMVLPKVHSAANRVPMHQFAKAETFPNTNPNRAQRRAAAKRLRK